MRNPADQHRTPMVPPSTQHAAPAGPGMPVPRPVTPGQPYQGTMLPPDFVLPYGATPESPMPIYVPEPGETGILVDADFYRWTLVPYAYRFCRPRIAVNGQRVPDTAWGTNFVPVAPGLHHIRVSTVPNWVAAWNVIPTGAPRQELGFADAMIPVQHGHRTRTCYQASMYRLHPGALGPEPQKYFPGHRYNLVFKWVVGALAVLIASLCVYSAVFG
ncbi:hypothetical protein [Nocardia sp. NPDC019395]|uniref:hypothetical protein n=1 Tax=Nocardia sp. NPDC019395 TaxID=3154686 RepID=UPI0033CC1D06